MPDWLGANWIWILLGVGVVWLMFRRGGMGCGMGGHGGHGESDPARKEQGKEHSMSTRDSRHRGGCH